MKRKVKMLVSMAGPDESWQPGQEYDFDEDVAVALCTLPEDGPRAEPVGWAPGKPDTPTPAKPKTAAKKPAVRGKRETAAVEPNETASPSEGRKRLRLPGRKG